MTEGKNELLLHCHYSGSSECISRICKVISRQNEWQVAINAFKYTKNCLLSIERTRFVLKKSCSLTEEICVLLIWVLCVLSSTSSFKQYDKGIAIKVCEQEVKSGVFTKLCCRLCSEFLKSNRLFWRCCFCREMNNLIKEIRFSFVFFFTVCFLIWKFQLSFLKFDFVGDYYVCITKCDLICYFLMWYNICKVYSLSKVAFSLL